jgi:hypothetical protein
LQQDARFGGCQCQLLHITVAGDTDGRSRYGRGALGIDVNGLRATLQAMVDGRSVGSIFANDTTYPVQLVSTKAPINDPRDLENIYIKTAKGRFVPMSSIATVMESPIAPSLDREQHRRAAAVTASLSDQFALGDATVSCSNKQSRCLQTTRRSFRWPRLRRLGQQQRAHNHRGLRRHHHLARHGGAV